VSPRAASRLESLGFPRVFDYAAGKADWGSYGLPLEGRADSSTRVSSLARAEAPTCRLDESVAEVAARLPEGWEICVVTSDRRVVLGVLGRRALRNATQTTAESAMTPGPTTAESAMTPGPSTIRPSARLEAIRERMREQNLTWIVVSRSDGTLFGVVRRDDLGGIE
jgi:CBS domain-containing protein